jgi:AraC-like DNA-binding protein
LTFRDSHLTFEDMAVIRATALSFFPEVVREAGGDPDRLLAQVGIDPSDAGRSDVFVSLHSAVTVLEIAAKDTSTPNLGRRLAALQGIEILDLVGIAASTARDVADALSIIERFLAAYSPGLGLRVKDLQKPGRSFIEYQLLDPDVVASPQHNELAVGVILRVLRHLLGDLHRPVEAHLPHEPLASPAEYLESYGCRTQFDQLATGLTIRTVDLSRPLRSDSHAHRDVVEYLETIVGDEAATLASVRTLVGRLLPSGRVTLEFVARQMNLHSKTLQRRLAAEGATFAGVVDTIRRDTAQRLLRDTRITMAHLARELGYSEQTVLTRSCHRWFGEGPAAYRRRLRDSDLAALSYRADNLS